MPLHAHVVERQTTRLASERIGDGNASDVVEVMSSYQRRLLGADPHGAARPITMSSPSSPRLSRRAQGVLDEVLDEIAARRTPGDGIVSGPVFGDNRATAIHDDGFRPFRSPVPFLVVGHGVVSDWECTHDVRSTHPLTQGVLT